MPGLYKSSVNYLIQIVTPRLYWRRDAHHELSRNRDDAWSNAINIFAPILFAVACSLIAFSRKNIRSFSGTVLKILTPSRGRRDVNRPSPNEAKWSERRGRAEHRIRSIDRPRFQSAPFRHPAFSRSKIARGCHSGALPISDAFPYFSNGDSFESVVTPEMKEASSAFIAF